MKTNNILNTLLGSIAIITLTACGSGSGGDSGSCGNMPSTKDSDKDGFYDIFDSHPNEVFENGTYTSLENVANSAGVQRVLKIAKERGVAINLQLGKNPPNIDGLYKTERGGNVVYANNSLNDRTTGHAITEANLKLCSSKGQIQRKSSSPLGYNETYGILRGDGKHFSYYGRSSFNYSSECYSYIATITSGKLDSKGGDITNYSVLIATLGYEELSQGACDPYKGANRMEEIFTTRDWVKVTDVDELEFVCVEDNKAYFLNETWKRDGKSCTCTKDLEIECK